MKKILFLLAALLGSTPVFAADLQAETSSQAVGEYGVFSAADNPDPMNHVVWKLYIFRAVPQSDHSDGAVEYLIAGLTPFPKDDYYVRLKINDCIIISNPRPKGGM